VIAGDLDVWQAASQPLDARRNARQASAGNIPRWTQERSAERMRSSQAGDRALENEVTKLRLRTIRRQSRELRMNRGLITAYRERSPHTRDRRVGTGSGLSGVDQFASQQSVRAIAVAPGPASCGWRPGVACSLGTERTRQSGLSTLWQRTWSARNGVRCIGIDSVGTVWPVLSRAAYATLTDLAGRSTIICRRI